MQERSVSRTCVLVSAFICMDRIDVACSVTDAMRSNIYMAQNRRFFHKQRCYCFLPMKTIPDKLWQRLKKGKLFSAQRRHSKHLLYRLATEALRRLDLMRQIRRIKCRPGPTTLPLSLQARLVSAILGFFESP